MSKKFQILGPGCYNCQKLAAQTEVAAQALGLEYEMEKITNINEITKFGVMYTPALVVDGEVKVSGRIPSVDELKGMLA
jgi:small redox-active disulfide protein 2